MPPKGIPFDQIHSMGETIFNISFKSQQIKVEITRLTRSHRQQWGGRQREGGGWVEVGTGGWGHL